MGAVKEALRRPLGHFTERTLAGLAIVLGAGVGFGILLVLVRTRWSPLHDVDHGVAQWLNDLVAPHGPLVTVLNALTDLGGRAVIIWLVSVAVVGLLIRKQGRLAVFLIVTGVGALVLDPALKTLVDRLRPEVDVPIGTYAGDSFPAATRSARWSRTGRCCWSSCRPCRAAGASPRSPWSPSSSSSSD